MSAKRIDAPETAALLAGEPLVGETLVQRDARMLARDMATTARAYGRATARVRKLRRDLKRAELDARELRRHLALLASAYPVAEKKGQNR